MVSMNSTTSLFQGLIHNTDKSTGTIQYTHLHQMLFNPYTLYTKKGPIDAVTSAMATLVHAVDPHVTTEVISFKYYDIVQYLYATSKLNQKVMIYLTQTLYPSYRILPRSMIIYFQLVILFIPLNKDIT